MQKQAVRTMNFNLKVNVKTDFVEQVLTEMMLGFTKMLKHHPSMKLNPEMKIEVDFKKKGKKNATTKH